MSDRPATAGGRPRALPAVALVGPTASGKSRVAHRAAVAVPGTEICSIDSMQVYRGLDLGTAKPSAAEQAEVPYHLIDLAEPTEEYTLARYLTDAGTALEAIADRAGIGLGVGGTGLYVQALLDGMEVPGRFPEVRARLEAEPDTGALHAELVRRDPVAAARMEPTNRRRVLRALEVTLGSGHPFSSYGPGVAAFPAIPTALIGLRWSRPELDRRIAARWEAMVDAGLLAEVEALASLAGAGEPLSPTARQALGYRELLDHLEGTCGLDEAISLAVARTRRFARRQDRWFRRDPRIEWWDVTHDEELVELAARLALRLAPSSTRVESRS